MVKTVYIRFIIPCWILTPKIQLIELLIKEINKY
nr:MAG TPA: hypothetical protein [Caudoviricetes sp.]